MWVVGLRICRGFVVYLFVGLVVVVCGLRSIVLFMLCLFGVALVVLV